ncbi:MAG: nickel transporter [Casimicrobiaceae bacterium]
MLCALAVALGARHGLDADHLATIDGLTRYNARDNPRLARAAGALFSLGHGVVVVLVALAAATMSAHWAVPRWLELTGAGVSVALLVALAFLNVSAVVRSPRDAPVVPLGVKARLIERHCAPRRPWTIAAIGAAFAFSFDTLSQVTLLAVAGSRHGNVTQALLVAGLFVLGMLAIDGVNGLWVSRMIGRADRMAIVASRVVALTVAATSATVASFTLLRVVLPELDAWAGGRELLIGAAVAGLVLAGFIASILAARIQSGPGHVSQAIPPSAGD